MDGAQTPDWPAAPAATLEGDRVRLEPLAEAHRGDLEAAGGRDPEVWRWVDPGVPESPAAFAGWFDGALRESAAGREVAFATIDRRTGRAVGSTRLLALRPADRVVEIGWTWLGREAWRTGINLEAKRLLLAHAFETLGCRRVELKTDARNRRSRAAIAQLGARFEGVFRKHRLVPVARDTAWYAIVDDEWPTVRERLDARIERRAAPPSGPAWSHAHLDALERFDIDGIPGLTWLPVRGRFGILGFGTNAYAAAAAGDTVVEDHTEAGSGHEELYVVLRGRARFTIDGDDLDAPAGTLVHLPSGVRRTAVAEEPGTAVLA
ncbi:MAG TPA: GNAT family N-acetyltransferase, partial [Solirubrobacteraceae bacterium]